MICNNNEYPNKVEKKQFFESILLENILKKYLYYYFCL